MLTGLANSQRVIQREMDVVVQRAVRCRVEIDDRLCDIRGSMSAPAQRSVVRATCCDSLCSSRAINSRIHPTPCARAIAEPKLAEYHHIRSCLYWKPFHSSAVKSSQNAEYPSATVS